FYPQALNILKLGESWPVLFIGLRCLFSEIRYVANIYFMDQQIIDLFDEYTHKPLSRQDFINRLAKLTGGMTAALTTLSLLEVNYAHAATIPEQDKDIITKDITYPGDGTTMKAYLAKPRAAGKYGGVLVIHE